MRCSPPQRALSPICRLRAGRRPPHQSRCFAARQLPLKGKPFALFEAPHRPPCLPPRGEGGRGGLARRGRMRGVIPSAAVIRGRPHLLQADQQRPSSVTALCAVTASPEGEAERPVLRQSASRLAEFAARPRKNSDHFSPRHARGEKYFSPRKRASAASALRRGANLAANLFAAISSRKNASAFFVIVCGTVENPVENSVEKSSDITRARLRADAPVIQSNPNTIQSESLSESESRARAETSPFLS